METMQLRVNRETPRAAGSLRRSIAHLVAVAIAAVIWFGAHPALAQSSTTVSPAGTNFTASSTSVRLTLGTVTVTCTGSVTGGGVPASPANVTPSGPVCAPLTTPMFTSCRTNLGTSATVIVSGAWQHCVQFNAGGSTATLIIPQRGVVASTTIFGSTCTATAAPNGPISVNGAWNNGPPPTLVFSSAPVPVQSGGGGVCPTGTSSSLTATYTVTPNITVDP